MEQKNIEEIFERANLQQIREFLLTGMERDKIDHRTYNERLEKDSHDILERIKNISKNDSEFDRIFSEFLEAKITYTEVFLEIGMKVGARLMFQLLYQD